MPAHLFEIEDLPFVPAWFRNYGADWIRFLSNRLDLYRPIAQLLAKQILDAKNRQLIDVCSGSGGGWLSLIQCLDALGLNDVQVTLTDKHPNLTSGSHLTRMSQNRLIYREHPVDILAVPWEGNNLRTMMLALHHFSDTQAQEILQRAIVAQAPVAIFDITGLGILTRLPRVIGYLMIPLALILNAFVPLLVIVGTPAVRPFQWTRILLTYVLPLIPLYIWWDATISILRAKHVNDLRRLASEADHDHAFLWDVGRTTGVGPRSLTYLLGRPARQAPKAPKR